MSIFNFRDEDALGKVASVDTTNVIVDVENIDQLKRLQVNHLAVLKAADLDSISSDSSPR